MPAIIQHNFEESFKNEVIKHNESMIMYKVTSTNNRKNFSKWMNIGTEKLTESCQEKSVNHVTEEEGLPRFAEL